MKKIIFAVSVALGLAASSPALAVSSCDGITSRMESGSTDKATRGQVSLLQIALRDFGYLQAEPSGYYGPQTKAAVALFQEARGIQPTSGVLGPITLASLRVACVTGVGEVDSSPREIEILAPAGESLRRGKSFDIEWVGPTTGSYRIDLVDEDGFGQGEISARVLADGQTEHSLSWKAGKVSVASDRGAKKLTAKRGTYRILITRQDQGDGLGWMSAESELFKMR